MKVYSRSQNSVLNSISAVVLSLTTTVLSFVVRTFFIKYLDDAYLGVNGLYSNIFTVLSLAELGIGNAIIFSLYKPIADNNKQRICQLVRFYRGCYDIIALSVFVIGLCIMPFLPILVNTDLSLSVVRIAYVFYLLDAVSNYLFVYKTTLITAFQKDRIVTRYNLLMNVTTSILQIVVLVLTNNIYWYIAVKIVSTLSFNYIASRNADKLYPFIQDRSVPKLPSADRKAIFSDVRAMFTIKMGSVVLNGTDNIIISAMISTDAVGVYSNYYMIIGAVKTIVNRLLHGFTASIGNLNSSDDLSRKKRVYLSYNYLMFALFTVGASIILALGNDFVNIWIGNKYAVDNSVLLILVICFCVAGYKSVSITYIQTTGLFSKVTKRAAIESILNIILSIIAAKLYGLFGVFLATAVSEVLTTVWYDPYVICKYGLSTTPRIYYINSAFYVIITALCCIATVSVCKTIICTSIIILIIKGILCVVISGIIILVFTFKTKEFSFVLSKANSILHTKTKGNKQND